MTDPRPITHDPDAQVFHYTDNGVISRLNYDQHDAVMTITGTFVPQALAGRGIAADLMRVALDWARAQGWQVIPRCSYAAAYLRRHPDQQDLIAQDPYAQNTEN